MTVARGDRAGIHIDVCICTFKRPKCLKKLLDGLQEQRTKGLFTFSVAVVDNDAGQSARPTVEESRPQAGFPIQYEVEPEQNISLARNRAVSCATGDFLAFIDDDEYPGRDWLATLFEAQQRSDATASWDRSFRTTKLNRPRGSSRGGFTKGRPTRRGQKLDWKDTARKCAAEKKPLPRRGEPLQEGVRRRGRGPRFLQEDDPERACLPVVRRGARV